MKLTVLGSGSAGNCYIIEDENTALLIECGVKWSEIQKAVDFDISKIVGCLVSHEHGDHCKTWSDLEKSGIPIFTGVETATKLGLKYSFPLANGITTRIGDFNILPFDVKHSGTPCLGFLINHESFGNMLFATDLGYSPYKFNGLNHILLECNYSEKILNERIAKGYVSRTQMSHVIEGHLSLDTCLEILRINDLSNVKNIVLLHLSDSNSNAKQFLNAVQNETGKPTYIADKEFSLQLSNF